LRSAPSPLAIFTAGLMDTGDGIGSAHAYMKNYDYEGRAGDTRFISGSAGDLVAHRIDGEWFVPGSGPADAGGGGEYEAAPRQRSVLHTPAYRYYPTVCRLVPRWMMGLQLERRRAIGAEQQSRVAPKLCFD
jgi:hypothetical protein